jgi:5,10-methylenetetrahydrofolate reductase
MLQQNISSNSFQQFQKLWERMALLNAHITEVNTEIEIVKSHIQELIGIDVSNLATLGDLSSLEGNLKQYTDDAVSSVDLTDYPTKDEIPDLSSYLKKSYIF